MWNHNSHFHDYLLHQCPASISRALDIGCGMGLFTQRLAERAEVVDAIDADSIIVTEASTRNAASNIRYFYADFLKVDLPDASYEAIIAIASLHHMDLEAALIKMRRLLRSSGTLIVLGLYREATIADYIYSAISVPLNLICLTWHWSSTKKTAIIAPARSADLSLDQIR